MQEIKRRLCRFRPDRQVIRLRSVRRFSTARLPARHAAGCHGADGIGTPVGADLSSGTWLWGDGSLAAITNTIKTGVPEPKQHPGAMPPFGGVTLTDSQVAAVASYVWAIGHQKK